MNEAQACTQRLYEITRADLPLSCPPREDRVWDAHPRVYLPIETTGEVVCPYCGAQYVLKDFAAT
ncbi:MAG: hypothetical protein A3F11_05365 [Gammaproteobacteria bacterium RIFCSPHIGHO2_12_FULL_37_14]|nr:MAG: hypothetical protein A3F11_05365 [Gammaproteobacteria bacterium RIFCSPHIGHO2_12_FULL_37_14]